MLNIESVYEQTIGLKAILTKEYAYTDWRGVNISLKPGTMVLVDIENGIAKHNEDHFEVTADDFELSYQN